MRLNKGDVGRSCLVKYDDIGRVEGMIVEIDDNRKMADVYVFTDRAIDKSVEVCQISELGDHVTPNGILESMVKC